MQIYLPIAEMAVPVESILLLGVLVGFLSGLFGVGGGFLTTPFLIFLGIPPAIAVGTQPSQLLAAGLSGVLGHWKRSNVDIKLGAVMLGGSVAGSLAGVMLFRFVQHIGQTDLVIPVLYVFFLGSIGLMMFVESLLSILRRKGEGEEEKKSLHHHPFFQALPYKMRFPRSRIYVSAILPVAIGFVGGLLVAMMGIGGGFLLVPAMIYILGMPTLLVVGTSLFQIAVTALITTILHAVTNQTVDFVLAVMLIIGGVIGAQIGLRFARRIKGAFARVVLSALLLIVCYELASQLFLGPDDLYATEVR